MSPDARDEFLEAFVAARAGDEAALKQFLHAIARRVTSYVATRLGRPIRDAIVEEVVTDILSTVWTYLPHVRATEPNSVWAWVFRIARTKIADAQRRAAGSTDVEVPLDARDRNPPDVDSTTEPLEEGAVLVLREISAIIQGSPEENQVLLYLYILAPGTWDQLGQDAGISAKAAEGRVARLIERIRREVQQRMAALPPPEAQILRDFLDRWRAP